MAKEVCEDSGFVAGGVLLLLCTLIGEENVS